LSETGTRPKTVWLVGGKSLNEVSSKGTLEKGNRQQNVPLEGRDVSLQGLSDRKGLPILWERKGKPRPPIARTPTLENRSETANKGPQKKAEKEGGGKARLAAPEGSETGVQKNKKKAC